MERLFNESLDVVSLNFTSPILEHSSAFMSLLSLLCLFHAPVELSQIMDYLPTIFTESSVTES